MVAEEEEEAVVMAASGELLVVMEVADLLVVEVEVVELEEVAGTLVVAAEEEATGHATTVVKEATLPEIALTSQRLMQDRAVAEVVVVVHATATTVESLGIWQGIVPQQPVPREMESAASFFLLSLFFSIH
jgi:hypothetical protein